MCDRCSFEIRIKSYLDCHCLYELPDGGHVPIPISTYAEWCYQCKTLCAAENLPDIVSTRKLVREARRAFWLQILSESKSFWQERLASAKRLHYVVSNRKSKPRCLSCGSFDHKELPLSGYPDGKRTILQIQHPDCGGNFIIDDRSPIMADIRGPDRYYTLEGIFLRSVSPFQSHDASIANHCPKNF